MSMYNKIKKNLIYITNLVRRVIRVAVMSNDVMFMTATSRSSVNYYYLMSVIETQDTNAR